MKRFLRLPSPAMVVALIALFATTSGVSYAVATGSISGREIKDGTILSKDVRSRGLTGADIKRDSIGGNAVKEATLGTVPSASVASGPTLFAVVHQNGTAVRNRGITSARRLSNGVYSVVFNQDVRSCAYSASIGDPSLDSPPAGEVGVSSLVASANGVRVVTRASNGNVDSRGFHLIVGC